VDDEGGNFNDGMGWGGKKRDTPRVVTWFGWCLKTGELDKLEEDLGVWSLVDVSCR
jgi:hypothetical protein